MDHTWLDAKVEWAHWWRQHRSLSLGREQGGEGQRIVLERQMEDRYPVHPPGPGKNHIPIWTGNNTQVYCPLTMGIIRLLQLQGRIMFWFREAQGPKQGKSSGSGLEDKLFRNRLRTAKIEQEPPLIGWKSPERCPWSAITGICNSWKKLPKAWLTEFMSKPLPPQLSILSPKCPPSFCSCNPVAFALH